MSKFKDWFYYNRFVKGDSVLWMYCNKEVYYVSHPKMITKKIRITVETRKNRLTGQCQKRLKSSNFPWADAWNDCSEEFLLMNKEQKAKILKIKPI